MPATSFQDEVSADACAAGIMGKLHDALLGSGYSGHDLEMFLVRLIYCLFADDTGIFPKDHFHYLLESRTQPDGGDTGAFISSVFQILNTPTLRRQTTLDEDLQFFPFVNGAFFAKPLSIPVINARMRRVLLECCAFDWSHVSPAIFGSMFQSVMDEEKRRNLGAHYTSERNILKVIHGLFLDELLDKLKAAGKDARKLEHLHAHISKLRFFDPACGCGNFLIIAYRELRLLEIEILKQLHDVRDRNSRQLSMDVLLISRIDVDSMYGVEIEEFPARIAEVALWLTDHQMNMRLSSEFGQTYIRLPLKKSPHIFNTNALRLDWLEVFPSLGAPDEAAMLYVLGNPPFVGKKARSVAQNEDMDRVCGHIANYRMLDYVCAWYVKTACLIKNTSARAAFVSTNSITQGEQPGILWPYLASLGMRTFFAHRTFRWSNEARGKASVYCVIVGFAAGAVSPKRLYDYEAPDAGAVEVKAGNINAYLVDAPDILIASRSKPICNVPELSFGSMPNDDGRLLLTEKEKKDLFRAQPEAARFVRPFISAREYLHGEKRWCLWLVGASPAAFRSIPEIKQRVEAVGVYRRASNRKATKRLAEYPSLFGEIRQPNSSYVLIPRHSSENRKYIPLAFFSQRHIAGDSCAILPGAGHYEFGVLSSEMHMAWVRQVCGRIKSDYRYSNNIVYNNFPWPSVANQKRKIRVEQAAKAVVEVRKKFPECALADLYDPNAMPKALVDAHKSLDEAVDACYGASRLKTEGERFQFLIALYLEYMNPPARSARASGESLQTGKSESKRAKRLASPSPSKQLLLL